MTLNDLIKAVFHYRTVVSSLIGAAITLGLGAAADPAVRTLIGTHPGIVVYIVAVYHVLLAAKSLLAGGDVPVTK